MRADLARQLHNIGVHVEADSFTVELPAGRMQHVRIGEHADGSLRLWSVVASKSAASAMPGGELLLLTQNRLTELVEFTVDRRGRWIAQTGLPRGPLSDEEIREYVRALAEAADRMEGIVGGKDIN